MVLIRLMLAAKVRFIFALMTLRENERERVREEREEREREREREREINILTQKALELCLDSTPMSEAPGHVSSKNRQDQCCYKMAQC